MMSREYTQDGVADSMIEQNAQIGDTFLQPEVKLKAGVFLLQWSVTNP